MTRDGICNTYSYNGEGMMTASNSAVYTLDALNQRVQKTGGSNPTETIYFGGKPIALLNPSTNAWTDLIWAGDSMIAEVPGSQTATPVYRLLDHEGSLALATDGSGNVLGSNLYAPYGQVMASSTNDPYLYTGLFQDPEYGGDHALYRNYSTEQARWLRPDPYNGSYDPYNPQSFNRYSYVNGNPLGYTDPSGLAGAGALPGVGGNACWGFQLPLPIGNVNPCNPVASLAGIGLSKTATYFSQLFNPGSVGLPANEIVPVLSFAFTIGCNFFSNSDLCGQSGWTSTIFTGKDKWVGTAINDTVAYVGMVDGLALATQGGLLACLAGGPIDAACDVGIALGVYTVLNDLYSFVLDIWGPPQFTGSLLPRPSDLGGLGTAPTGIPNHNLSLDDIFHR